MCECMKVTNFGINTSDPIIGVIKCAMHSGLEDVKAGDNF